VSAATDIQPPGYFIREELEARGWTQRDLAFVLGMSEQAVNMIVSGKRGISPDMAKALGEAFGVHPDFFANLQKAYEMSRARDPEPGVAKRAKMQSVYPVREMIKRGWLEETDMAMLEIQLMRFFEKTNLSEIPHLDHAAKKTSYDETPAVQLAWLFRARQLAKSIAAASYSETRLRDSLQILRSLVTDPEEARHVPRIIAESGVRFVIVEALPGAKIDGACFWFDNSSPCIAMSLRLDRIDNFWFVLRHEMEHVLRKHGRKQEIIDVDICVPPDDSIPEEEKVANESAAEFCVSRSDLESFVIRKAPFFSERDIVGFARRLQIHPGIAVGQIQNKTARWDLLRRYLVKVRHFVVAGAVYDGWGTVANISL